MFWKLLGLQRLLDDLFDGAWLRMDLPCTAGWWHDDAAQPSQD